MVSKFRFVSLTVLGSFLGTVLFLFGSEAFGADPIPVKVEYRRRVLFDDDDYAPPLLRMRSEPYSVPGTVEIVEGDEALVTYKNRNGGTESRRISTEVYRRVDRLDAQLRRMGIRDERGNLGRFKSSSALARYLPYGVGGSAFRLLIPNSQIVLSLNDSSASAVSIEGVGRPTPSTWVPGYIKEVSTSDGRSGTTFLAASVRVEGHPYPKYISEGSKSGEFQVAFPDRSEFRPYSILGNHEFVVEPDAIKNRRVLWSNFKTVLPGESIPNKLMLKAFELAQKRDGSIDANPQTLHSMAVRLVLFDGDWVWAVAEWDFITSKGMPSLFRLPVSSLTFNVSQKVFNSWARHSPETLGLKLPRLALPGPWNLSRSVGQRKQILLNAAEERFCAVDLFDYGRETKNDSAADTGAYAHEGGNAEQRAYEELGATDAIPASAMNRRLPDAPK